MKKLAVVFALACVFTAQANAAHGDTRLDTAASTVAGKALAVSCGDSNTDWADTERGVGFTFDTDGFTQVGISSVLYLAPRVCDTLEADLTFGPSAVGDYWNGLAIKVFVHEATHQALQSRDEGLVECTALRQVATYAPLFGYTPTVKVAVYVKVKTGVYKRVVKTVPNPALARVVRWANYWHSLLPASYKSVC